MQKKQAFQDCEISHIVTYKYLVPLNMLDASLLGYDVGLWVIRLNVITTLPHLAMYLWSGNHRPDDTA
jgi:hypothetical protein